MKGIDAVFTVQIKADISLWDALKLRITGGKYMESYWIKALNKITTDDSRVNSKRRS